MPARSSEEVKKNCTIQGSPQVGLDGSSPRMWGTLTDSCYLFGPCRFIPTHVGNTFPGLLLAQRDVVHPHACGEH